MRPGLATGPAGRLNSKRLTDTPVRRGRAGVELARLRANTGFWLVALAEDLEQQLSTQRWAGIRR